MRYHSCKKCSAKAIWRYTPNDNTYYCDSHVPRGCSCFWNEETATEDTDELGRLFPCCEYDYEIKGFDLVPEKYDEEYFDD